MIDKAQFHTLQTVKKIDEEIEDRKTLIREMVGRLWPVVLSSEIEVLEELKAKLELESFIREQARAYGVKVRIYNQRSVLVNGSPCGGCFCHEEKMIAVAKQRDLWEQTLVHEFCHLLQWAEDESGCEKECNADGALDDWLSHKIELSPRELDDCLSVIVAAELDCEKRAYRMLKEFSIPCENYVQRANSYLNFYPIVGEFRLWTQGVGPYDVPEIWQEMPKRFSTKVKLSQKLRSEYIHLLGIEE